MISNRFTIFFIAALFSVGANAGVIFQDNFDDEGDPNVSVLNYTGFTNWSVLSGGSVDLLADPNSYGINCVGNTGKCVDLDGSTRSAGTLQSNAFSLNPGVYTLSFDISGNQRGGSSDEMLVTLGGLLNESFTLAATAPWQTIIRNIRVSTQTPNFITFNHSGRDNVGIILDNVALVPEPGTIALLGMGLIGFGVRRFKR